MEEVFRDTIRLLESKAVPYVCYRVPNENGFSICVQRSHKLKEIAVSELERAEGFLVSGFEQSMQGNAFLLEADYLIHSTELTEGSISILEGLPNYPEHQGVKEIDHSKEEYLKAAGHLISLLKKEEIRKVVLSRSLKQKAGRIPKADFFLELMKVYPDAMVYLLSIPEYGSWIGATPEELLSVNQNMAETVSLAGTLAANQEDWTPKELEEQQMVTDYVEQVLSELKIEFYQKSQPFTSFAGKLAHLKTIFRIEIGSLEGKWGKLVSNLHPTPAVCGIPKEKAFQQIVQTENYNRQLYTGFLGPWRIQDDRKLFVNLRCARILDDGIQLFVGGGLTAQSKPENEWEETVKKSETLLSVLKKL